MDQTEEFLNSLREAIGRWPTVTQIVIDEYQLTLRTSNASFTVWSEWILVSPEGATERLDSDFRNRTVDAYAICRIIGHDIVSAEMSEGEDLTLGFNTGDRLTAPKRQDGPESFTVSGAFGIWIF